MKFLRVGLLATLVTALCMTGITQAGQREGAFSLSPMVGYHVFEGDQNTEDDVAYGLSLGYNVSKQWATEFEVRYTPTETSLGQDVDARTDLCSLGTVIYEMITGRQAFPGATRAAIFDKILNRVPPTPTAATTTAGTPASTSTATATTRRPTGTRGSSWTSPLRPGAAERCRTSR